MLTKSGTNRKITTSKLEKPRLVLTTKKIKHKEKQHHVPTRRLVMTLSQRKKRQPRVPTQRLLIAVSQRKRRQLHVLTQRYVIVLNRGKKSLPHVHVTLLKKRAYVHSEGTNMHCLNQNLLQRRPISRTWKPACYAILK